MSDEEDFVLKEIPITGYQFEPVTVLDTAPVAAEAEEDPAVRAEAEDIPAVEQWCSCGHCQRMPTAAQRVCCQDHCANNEMDNTMECITDHEGVFELTRPAVLRVAYESYKYQHGDKFDPEKHDDNGKNRFCSYRQMVFWLIPSVRQKERLPLPACLYAWIQAIFPPTDDEEIFADWEFSEFVYAEESV